MMICQQSEDGSKCPFPDYCKLKGPCKAPEHKPPPPTLAEFERLITEHEINTRSRNTEQEESRAALMAYVVNLQTMMRNS